MVLGSPLFLTKVECPICGTLNEFETIRVGAYTEGERQTDFCPSFIKWRNAKYQRFHPLLFFTATCSSCFYTREFNPKFKEWVKDNNFRTYRLKAIKNKHLGNLAGADSFIKLVGGLLDKDKYPHETAILKLLLAAFDELLYDHPSNLDLGRFYLRIAWLFRQAGDDGDREPNISITDPFEDIGKSISDLQNWMAGWERNIEYFEKAVAAYEPPNEDEQPSENSPPALFAPNIAQMHDIEKECRSLMEEIEVRMKKIKDAALTSVPETFGGAFYDYGSFDEFLGRLAQMWDGVPHNEYEATRFAVRYYILAFETGKEIAHGNQSIQAAYLIGELSRQIGDHDTARQYFNKTIKMGQDFINEIRGDRTRTALARKLLELALAQGKKNLAEAK
jgi:tetratricopeptide (TPR) repeat protein